MTGYRVVRDRKPLVWFPWLLSAVLASLLVAVWPIPTPPGFRAACDAHGGLTVRTEDGPLCLWAGAVIPVQGPTP